MSNAQLAIIPAALVARACVRCELPLVDPASVQAGIGPVCRRMANKLLAKEIHTAWDGEQITALLLVSAETSEEEDRARFSSVYQKIFTSKGVESPEGVAGEDWRQTVRELAYLASVAPNTATYEALIGAIRGVGYPVYAEYVSGNSSTGKAELSFVSGRVQLQAVKNPAAVPALRKAGARFDYEARVWIAPAEKAEGFVKVAQLYWPLAKGAEETLEAASKYLAAKKPAPAYSLELDKARGLLVLKVPFNPAFIEALKARIPHGPRRWEAPVWVVKPAYEATLRELLKEHF